jgi:Tol biopolymer transport system component
MYRLLLLALALPLAATADLGRAAADEYNIDIVAVDLGGRETNLSHDPAVDVAPAVARDGRIAFVSTRNGAGAELYVMDGDGRDVRRLTTNAGVTWNEALDVTGVSWSPGGEKLAFDGLYLARGTDCSQHCAGWKVSVVGADGSGPGGRSWIYVAHTDGRTRRLTAGHDPTWSRDGRRLAFIHGYKLFAIGRDGKADDASRAGASSSSAQPGRRKEERSATPRVPRTARTAVRRRTFAWRP